MDTFASQDTEYDMCPSGFLCKCAAFLNDINRKNAEKSKNKPDVSSGGGRPLVADLQPSGAPLSLCLSQVSSPSVLFGSSSQSRLSSDMESC